MPVGGEGGEALIVDFVNMLTRVDTGKVEHFWPYLQAAGRSAVLTARLREAIR